MQTKTCINKAEQEIEENIFKIGEDGEIETIQKS